MKVIRVALFAAVLVTSYNAPTHSSEQVFGAGATFPLPLYTKLTEKYKTQSGGSIDYRGVGSGAGIGHLAAGRFDFAGSDRPLPPSELDHLRLVQFPMIIGGVVIIHNIPGVTSGKLKLDEVILSNIYLGNILYWDDEYISSINPDIKLPHLAIVPIRRLDASGTTFLFNRYLSAGSPELRYLDGEMYLPLLAGAAEPGNTGVAFRVQQNPGAIGYVEYTYARQNSLPLARLRNSFGEFILPDAESFRNSAATIDWARAPDFQEIPVGRSGEGCWPITGASYVLMPKYQNLQKQHEILRFLDWVYQNRGHLAEALYYVPMPQKATERVRERWSRMIGPNFETGWGCPACHEVERRAF